MRHISRRKLGFFVMSILLVLATAMSILQVISRTPRHGMVTAAKYGADIIMIP